MKNIPADTFSTIKAKIDNFEDKDFKNFFSWLYGELSDLKVRRDNHYRNLRTGSSRWITWSPRVLTFLGAFALLLTALASAVTLMPPAAGSKWAALSQYALLAAMAIYAVMGAIALYERGTDISSAYFRHLAVGIAIRNLWNKFLLTILKEYLALSSASDGDASRRRICELAEAFCNDLDKLVSDEQTEWRTEFINSLNELDQVANKGAGDIRAQMEELAKTVAKAAEEAKDAAARIEAATKPGHVNLAISGEVDGEIAVLVDDIEKIRGTAKRIVLERIIPGAHKLSIKAKKGATVLDVSEMYDVKPGVQSHSIALE
ncbi:MAG: hypothetical protein EOS07_07490 [Mesorhizobium sp.]|uniref:hypothetical protein n=1 Tax=Mesorhizobium sp. TaxID=1871066 RepID=UPI000FE40828|nr:hypothetical protein [Mesorhizobium sp.]RWO10992.1 MAG: hypothetical protein EOS07_07490 [Mesorhizobium sp.]RWP07908.1 MAG: hypothetical protein EOQ99_04100 [Mesorhizobium sp.]RWQ22697.1 MAG: hypothetical protein EOR92_06685 [Mesorhizobium sp.]RWQ55228.1 MAG: hypothetical protein EOS84_11750 [Mesorhizobium sp.]RWQ61585.1 MAG: hypothetical protein EOS83_00460 [Mesorhizobium sp.]